MMEHKYFIDIFNFDFLRRIKIYYPEYKYCYYYAYSD